MIEEPWRIGPTLFTDGGCISKNPSPLGGTWAWCLVEKGEKKACNSGVVPVSSTRFATDKLITNNVMEYIAAVYGLGTLPNGWSGYICSDSQITLGRLFSGWKLHGLPHQLVDLAEVTLRRLGMIEPILLQGHPTRADLERGIGAKRSLPVSCWNKWCDEACQRMAAEFLARGGVT